VFVLIGLLWMGFVFTDFIGSTLGDCLEDRWCEGRKTAVNGLIFWRAVAVSLMILIAYRLLRQEPEK
jgi:hypothetical protein